ncbi:unnamed protein product, partial [Ectocarpus sp. 12 AP-2014]
VNLFYLDLREGELSRYYLRRSAHRSSIHVRMMGFPCNCMLLNPKGGLQISYKNLNVCSWKQCSRYGIWRELQPAGIDQAGDELSYRPLPGCSRCPGCSVYQRGLGNSKQCC